MVKIFILLFFTIGFCYFGKNKVKYQTWHWKVLETKDFDVYYQKENRYIAEIVCSWAKDIYQNLQEFFEYKLKRKIPIIIFKSHHDFMQTEIITQIIPEEVRGFAEIFKYRVVLPYRGSFKELYEVLTHELVHIFCFDYLAKGSVEKIFTRYPIYLLEGIAEYLAKPISYFDIALIVDALLNNYLPLPSDVFFKEVDMPYLAYKVAQSFVDFLISSWGKEKFLLFLRQIGTKKFFCVFKKIYNQDFPKVEKQWLLSLKRQYLPYYQKDFLETEGEEIAKGLSFSSSCGGGMLVIYDEKEDRVYLKSLKDKKIIRDISWTFKGVEASKRIFGFSEDSEYILLCGYKKGKESLIIYDIIKDQKEEIEVDFLDFVSWAEKYQDTIYIAGIKDGRSKFVLLKGGKEEVFDFDSFIKKFFYLENNEFLIIAQEKLSFKILIYNLSDKNKNTLLDDLPDDPKVSLAKDKNHFFFICKENKLPALFVFSLKDKKIYKLTDFSTPILEVVQLKENEFMLSSFYQKEFRIYKVSLKEKKEISHLETEKKELQTSQLPDAKVVDYKPKFIPDVRSFEIYYSAIGGLQLLACLSASDMLANHKFYLLTTPAEVNLSNFIIYYSYLKKRPKLHTGLYNWNYPTLLEYRKESGRFFLIQLPLSKFERFEVEFFNRQLNNKQYNQFNFGFVKDTTVWEIMPKAGLRTRAVVEFELKDKFKNFLVDLRYYKKLSENSSLGFRYLKRESQGEDKEIYVVGGVWIFPLFIDAYPLRGYRLGEFLTSDFSLLQSELRFLFIKQAIVLIFNLEGIYGRFFVDTLYNNREYFTSAGFGLILFLKYLPISMDWAWRLDKITKDRKVIFHLYIDYPF